MFDNLYLNIFGYYKPKLKQKANTIAVLYISVLQFCLLLLLVLFFVAFGKQMNLAVLSSEKILFILIFSAVIIYFKNWMHYSGRKRNALKAKNKKTTEYHIVVLWLIPFALIFLSVLFYNKLIF